MSERLRQFVLDVSKDPDRAKRLTADPEAELDQTDLSVDEREIVLSRDPDALREALGAERSDLLAMNSFFKKPLEAPAAPAVPSQPRPGKPSRRKPAKKAPAKKRPVKKAPKKAPARKGTPKRPARKTAKKATRKTTRKTARKGARKGPRRRG